MVPGLATPAITVGPHPRILVDREFRHGRRLLTSLSCWRTSTSTGGAATASSELAAQTLLSPIRPPAPARTGYQAVRAHPEAVADDAASHAYSGKRSGAPSGTSRCRRRRGSGWAWPARACGGCSGCSRSRAASPGTSARAADR